MKINKNWHNSKNYIQYEKMINDEINKNINLFVILSGRAKFGKTIQSINFMIEKYNKNKAKSLMIFNFETMINTFKIKDGIKKNYLKNIDVNKNGIYWKDKANKTKELIIFFACLNTYYKGKVGTRPEGIKYVFYDEFNEGIKGTIKTNQDKLFYSLLNSYIAYNDEKNNNVKVFLLGNVNNLQNAILKKLNIKKYPREKNYKIVGDSYFKTLFYNPRTEIEQKDLNNSSMLELLGEQLDLTKESIQGEIIDEGFDDGVMRDFDDNIKNAIMKEFNNSLKDFYNDAQWDGTYLTKPNIENIKLKDVEYDDKKEIYFMLNNSPSYLIVKVKKVVYEVQGENIELLYWFKEVFLSKTEIIELKKKKLIRSWNLIEFNVNTIYENTITSFLNKINKGMLYFSSPQLKNIFENKMNKDVIT